MLRFQSTLLILACLGWTARTEAAGPPDSILLHTGMCDASAAISLGHDRFVVANDEDSVLRIYASLQGGDPIRMIDLSTFLQLDVKHPETDVEGAAQMDSRIYWITSHGRNKDGKYRDSRHRFFATRIVQTGGEATLLPEGKPYRSLLLDMLQDPRLAALGLGPASQLAPKEPNAFNIEGLCAMPDGAVLIGFRNPIPQGRALLVPMLNPDQVVEGRLAKFGDPVFLDLDGRGVRDLAWDGRGYWIVAGSYDGKGGSRLYRWTGRNAKPEHFKAAKFEGFNPEAVVVYATQKDRLHLLSDDGTMRIDGEKCKEVPDPRLRRFRSTWVDLQE